VSPHLGRSGDLVVRRTLIFAIFLAPVIAGAEVLDKEFSQATVTGVALCGSMATFWAARVRPWALAVLFPIVGMFFWLHLSEFLDPYVGPAMAREGGIAYVVSSWLSPLAVVLSTAYGFALRLCARACIVPRSKSINLEE
jgi:hypothetical protein